MRRRRQSIILLVIAILLLVWMMFEAMTPPKVAAYEPYVVQPGDTLWQIAKEYNPGYENIDVVIVETKKANGKTVSTIYIGETIDVAVME